jgi:signal transduction histidine kinase
MRDQAMRDQAQEIADRGARGRSSMSSTHQVVIEGKRNRLEPRNRIETVVETLATLGRNSETLEEVAHDARNMVSALGLYCDLLDEPGVLAVPYLHYGQELRLVAAASRRLVQSLVALDACRARLQGNSADRDPLTTVSDSAVIVPPGTAAMGSAARPVGGTASSAWHADLLPALPVANLAAELLSHRNLLSALAGPAILLSIDTAGGAMPVRLTAEELTRVLVNLVKNAAEAMPGGGRISIALSDRPAASGTLPGVVLSIEDNGPGIPQEALESIFVSGYTTRRQAAEGDTRGSFRHHGLGLAITRSIVESAGGRITAGNRVPGGARFEIELPVKTSCPPRL